MAPETKEDTLHLLRQLVGKPQTGRRNAHELRQPYFQKYPKLWGIHLALFRVRHLKHVYDIDTTDQLFQLISRQELDSLADALTKDEEAMRILSTFAVNYLYLYKQILLGEGKYIKPERFLRISEAYDINNAEHLQLMIYLFTHCIIGESNFYTQTISPKNLPTYQTMLARLEQLVGNNLSLINLDSRLEFLVCCRICDFDSHLFDPIYEECRNSISQEGHFLVDSLNQNKQEDRKNFEGSEHRNVLFIMSNSPYQPHSTLV